MGYSPAAVIDTPARIPAPFGLFSAVSLAETATERWESGVEWEGLSCDPAAVAVGDCDAPTGFPLTFAPSGGVGHADAFTVYGTYKCSPIGNSLDHAQRMAEQVLLAREEAAAERHLWDTITDSPTVVTPPATGVASAVATLEGWIAEEYGSLGVLHMGKHAATLAAASQLLVVNGPRMFTALGTPVVVGSGYPNNATIAATPSLFGYRSTMFTSSNRPGDLLDRGTNDLHGLAERNYLIGYDVCGSATAQIG